MSCYYAANLTTMKKRFKSPNCKGIHLDRSQSFVKNESFVVMEMTFLYYSDDFILNEFVCQITHSKLFGFPHITILLQTNFEPQKKLLTWCVGYQKNLATFITVRYKEFELLSKFGIHNLNQPKYANLERSMQILNIKNFTSIFKQCNDWKYEDAFQVG